MHRHRSRAESWSSPVRRSAAPTPRATRLPTTSRSTTSRPTSAGTEAGPTTGSGPTSAGHRSRPASAARPSPDAHASHAPGVSPVRESWPHQFRSAAGEPDGALVLLHGRGTDEFDLVPLLDALDPERRLVGLTPRAPLSLPPGGAHWDLVRQGGYPDRETFYASLRGLSEWLDSLPDELGLPWDRIVLGGFSMGAVMSYATGLGPGRPTPAGIMALSGFIPTVEGFELDLERAAGLPVAIAHGTADPVISVEFGRDARDRMEAAGADVLYHESPVPHTIDPAIVPDLRDWLAKAVPSGAGA